MGMWVFVLALLVAGCSGTAVHELMSPVDAGVDTRLDASTDPPEEPDAGLDTSAPIPDATIDSAPQDAPVGVLDTGVDAPIDSPDDHASCECAGSITQLHAQIVPMPAPGETLHATAACDGSVRVNLGVTCLSGCIGTTADTCWEDVPIESYDGSVTFSCVFPHSTHGTHNVMQYYCNSCVKWNGMCN